MVEFQCAVAARDREESMFATASQVRRWMLIEVRGAWGRNVVTDSDLARYAPGEWRQRLRDAGVRAIAIRRDLERSSQESLHVFSVESGSVASRGRIWQRRVATLHAAADVAGDLSSGDRGDDGEQDGWLAHADPLVLVCTNGRHDPCCATFGRPLARALRSGDRSSAVWECSHIGGDRFAGNLVILPEGLYFGRCDETSGRQVVDSYRRGEIHLDNYRGRSVLGFQEQAAEFFVRRELDVTAIEGIVAVRRTEAPGRFVVEVADGNSGLRRVEVQIARSETTATAPITCTGPVGLRVPRYELVSIDEGR